MIIGLAGLAGSGKDTVAMELVNNYGFQRLAFADNLKLICMWAFGLNEKECHNPEIKERKFVNQILLNEKHIEKVINFATNVNKFEINQSQKNKMYGNLGKQVVFSTPRQVLQFVGTELLRDSVDDLYHVKVVKQLIDMRKIEHVVITDARFPNERNEIKSWGGLTVLIDRGQKENKKGIQGHASENSLEGEYDYVFKNDGKISDIPSKVEEMVEFINNAG